MWDAHNTDPVSITELAPVRIRSHRPNPKGAVQASSSACRSACVVRLTVLNQTRSKGHKFKLLGVTNGVDFGTGKRPSSLATLFAD